VSNKTISSWRTRNSLPIEAVLQASEETNRKIEYFLLGAEETRPEMSFKFEDLRMRDFQLAGEAVLAALLQEYAAETLAFMSDEDMERAGAHLGIAILGQLAFVLQERKALYDTGKLDDATFDEYVRKAARPDLPYWSRAVENRTRAKDKGPQ